MNIEEENKEQENGLRSVPWKSNKRSTSHLSTNSNKIWDLDYSILMFDCTSGKHAWCKQKYFSLW